MKTVTTTYEGYLDWRAQAPWGPCGPLVEPPVFLIPMSDVRARAASLQPITRWPTITPRTLARPARVAYGPRFTALDRSGSRAVATTAPTPPKKCTGCGTPVATRWELWNICRCGRVRPPSPAEQSAQLRLRLALALGDA